MNKPFEKFTYIAFKRLWKLLDPKERAELLIEEYDEQVDFYDFEKVAFYYQEAEFLWIGIDNTTGDCWVEEFHTESEAKTYIENSERKQEDDKRRNN